MDEINRIALERFVNQPVKTDMIWYLVDIARSVILCDSDLTPPLLDSSQPSRNRDGPPTPPLSCELWTVFSTDDVLPTLEEFIIQLVKSSKVTAQTLLSTLVYLDRIKSKLQPTNRGMRCTAHRIFLAALIFAAKYLNDNSPKNKHWANFTHIKTADYTFGFANADINLMEKRLLALLDWELGITEQDLHSARYLFGALQGKDC